MLSARELASKPQREREKFARGLSQTDRYQLPWLWKFWARPNQVAPSGSWFIWLLIAGRAFGKTRTGAEWVRDRVENHGAMRIALVGRTVADVRDVMIRGESGLLNVCPPWNRPRYIPSKRTLVWPNGATATTYSAEQPDQLRGPQHDTAWSDELAAWQYPEAFDQLQFGMRLETSTGEAPQIVATTTPRPLQWLRDLINEAGARVALTRGSTYDNYSLPPSYLDSFLQKYEGTRLGRQELLAEMLDDAPGALWRRDQIDQFRVVPQFDKDGSMAGSMPVFRQVVIGIDPAVTAGEESDLTGIVVVGLAEDNHAYVLADRSGRYTPAEWADKVRELYVLYGADRVVAEVNQGGDLVESNLRASRLPEGARMVVRKVHASKGKRTRAEPVAALYEQGRVHHVGFLGPLEDELCSFEFDADAFNARSSKRRGSPDRLDALVWAVTDLMVEKGIRRGSVADRKILAPPAVTNFEKLPASLVDNGMQSGFGGYDGSFTPYFAAVPNGVNGGDSCTPQDLVQREIKRWAGG